MWVHANSLGLQGWTSTQASLSPLPPLHLNTAEGVAFVPPKLPSLVLKNAASSNLVPMKQRELL